MGGRANDEQQQDTAQSAKNSQGRPYDRDDNHSEPVAILLWSRRWPGIRSIAIVTGIHPIGLIGRCIPLVSWISISLLLIGWHPLWCSLRRGPLPLLWRGVTRRLVGHFV